ncbi:MAG: DegT/DnrJ/EryC1/StrS family aminotransferase [Firmicutes bacterium]|nr:DegT/DnrJ/EryC1/StrS family aminotransferase [Bacillota bacterium]
MPRLAINGGDKVRKELFPAYRPISSQEEEAVLRVIRSGVLSKFLGAWHEDFYGGPEVQALEREWAEHFQVKHAISVNSATSGLYCAVGATGAGPGDEIIASPYTMSASATSALIFNSVPVFADIEEDFFCLDPISIESRITPRTRAIVVVDIFGQPYDAERINALARKHNLLVIEDAAQAPGARYKGKYAGTLGDIGVYSLNYHKHIHSGEGGMLVTDNDELAERVRLIRNHAESVVGPKGTGNLINMIGFNFRMTELEAAVAREQLKKLPDLLDKRKRNVNYLSERLRKIPGLEPARERDGCEHAFYVHPLKYRGEVTGIPRDRFIEAVKAELMPSEMRLSEGVKIGCGYVKPLYLLPMFQELTGYGDKGCPFRCGWYKGEVSYQQGICPVVERMHFSELVTHELIHANLSDSDLDDVVSAFQKVWEYRGEL